MLFMKTNRASICRSFVPQCHAWNSFLFWQGVWIWRGFNIMSRRLKIKEKVMHLNEAGSVIYRCCLFPTNLCSKPVLVSITWCSAYRRCDNLSFSHWGRVMSRQRARYSSSEEASDWSMIRCRFVRFVLVHESRFSDSIRKGGGAVVVVEVGELNVSRAIVFDWLNCKRKKE